MTTIITTSKFLFRTATLVRLIIPLGLFYYHNHNLTTIQSSTGLSAVLSHPIHSIDHLREGLFINEWASSSSSSLSGGNDLSTSSSSPSSFSQALSVYQGPPLLLAIVERLESYLSSAALLIITSRDKNNDEEKQQKNQQRRRQWRRWGDVIYTLILSLLVDGLLSRRLMDIAQRRRLKGRKQQKTMIDMTEEEEDERREMMEELKMPLKLRPPSYGGLLSILDPSFDSSLSSSSEGTANDDASFIIPTIAGGLYYCHPATILSSAVFRNCQNLYFWCFIEAISAVVVIDDEEEEEEGRKRRINVPWVAFLLAVLSYADVFHVVYIVPFVLMAWRRTRRGTNGTDEKGRMDEGRRRGREMVVGEGMILFFLLYFISLLFLSHLLHPSSSLPSHYHKHYDYYNLSPNLSPLWYFSMNMFHRFRTYFRVIVIGLPYTFIMPLTIRFYRYPLELAITIQLLQFSFHPIQTLNHLIYLLSLLLLSHPRTLVRMTLRASAVPLLFLIVPVILFITFAGQWLDANAGNPNYLFFQCFAFNIFFGLVVLDFVDGGLRRDKARRILVGLEKKREKGDGDGDGGVVVDGVEEKEVVMKNGDDDKKRC